MGLSVRVAGNTVYAQMHARARRICGDSHELALHNVPITITITITIDQLTNQNYYLTKFCLLAKFKVASDMLQTHSIHYYKHATN
jgi:hypothetical protein